ncbi:unnamed protein product [Trichobilharzia regenti]|nr:unnamed protein product [Trichobilharzia regenti]
MSNEFNLIVEEINPGWTKKRITELLKEAENREILYMKSCQADMEKAVVQLRNAALSFIAKLPTEILNKPYFQGIQQYENGDGKNVSYIKRKSSKSCYVC